MPSPPKAKTASVTVFLLGMPRSLQTIANGYTLLPEPTELYRFMTVGGADPFISLSLRQSPGCVPMGLTTTTNQRPRRGAVDPELLPVPCCAGRFLRSSTSAGLTGSRLSVSAGLFSNRLRALYGNAGSVVYYPRVPDGHWP
ncbi:hypothetical protein AARAC_004867 [Aspergillus arachidicola]|uniref:Uncharacterized protein n=1 Tax=Aspergillus arachidicola TaxID=656916 RepID=A0A2G7FRK6_9EURO|nr:hypothetical protein AARAC_004867 [Aspergillus arachidicola]